MYKYLTISGQEGVAVMTFQRPDQLNAMNRAFMDEIIDALHSINRDNAVRAVIITGNGRAFMAGADIKEYAAQTDEEFLAFQKKGWDLYNAIEQSEKPYIAAVNGFALGGGFEIALACDMIVACPEAQFGLPEIHLGLVPGGGGTQRLIQKISINRVRELLYTGGKFTTQKMYEWGIVNYIAPQDKLMEVASDLAQKMTRRPRRALSELKKLALLSTAPILLSQRMATEAETLYALFHTQEAQEKIQAFANK